MSEHATHAHHKEKHFTAGALVRDLILGMADGLTVPFALAAGLASATGTNSLVVTAGLAELAAGAISMGLGGYLAGRGEIEHYAREKRREEREIIDIPDEEEREIEDIFAAYGVAPNDAAGVISALKRQPEHWRNFMMKFELGLDEPDPNRARLSALTIGGSYALGGAVPLAPYVFLTESRPALIWSIVLTLTALLIFGYVKGRVAGTSAWPSAVRTALIGAAAAGAAYSLAKMFAPVL